MPLYFDDVKDDGFLKQITEGFDDGEVYETAEVTSPSLLLLLPLLCTYRTCFPYLFLTLRCV